MAGWYAWTMRDLQYGACLLTRSPAFATLVVLTLALGVAATTGVFTVIATFLLRPVPFRDAAQLAMNTLRAA